MAGFPAADGNVSRSAGVRPESRARRSPAKVLSMSLRVSLVAAVAFALAVSLAVGCGLAGWHARRSVRAELTAALSVGVQAIQTGLGEAALSRDPDAEVLHLVRTFDGDRHVIASLLDGSGGAVAQSRLLSPASQVPRWFRGLVAPRLAPVEVPVGAGAIRLRANPANEVGEVWGQFCDAVAVLAVFCALAALLVPWTVGRALRPVARLRSGLSRVASGDYAARVAEDGPPELAVLAGGFNRMAAHLDSVQAQNARLNEHLTRLQEEERADLARDLHDEIGPSLFAVSVTAATIQQLAATGCTAEIPKQVHAIQDVVAHVQRCVKGILGRLRPVGAVEFGLTPAIETLVAFWRARYPDIAFTVAVAADEDVLGETLKETIYRVVQEGLANAIRHGKPDRVEIAVTGGPESVLVAVSDDGVASPAGAADPGFGLRGMRERVSALGGTLSIEPGNPEPGWRITACLPSPCSAEP